MPNDSFKMIPRFWLIHIDKNIDNWLIDIVNLQDPIITTTEMHLSKAPNSILLQNPQPVTV